MIGGNVTVKKATIHAKFKIVCKYVVKSELQLRKLCELKLEDKGYYYSYKINELICRWMRIGVEDVDIKITHKIRKLILKTDG